MPQKDGKLLMIPGPCEFHEDVLKVVGEASPSHVAPSFIEEFGSTIGMLRKVFLTSTGQPFVIAGSGSLGWDFVACNLMEPGEKALICNTGYFSDSWATCIKAYKGQVVNLQMPVGGAVCPKMLEAALKKEKYKIVCLTQVDTSTGVKNDIKTLASIVKTVQPECLVTVDGVCAFAAEELRFDDWGIDAALTGSQKALGVPPGLMVCVMSQVVVVLVVIDSDVKEESQGQLYLHIILHIETANDHRILLFHQCIDSMAYFSYLLLLSSESSASSEKS
mmetsp:Transcript_10587/g.14681  ORF Transcript_10587/g.14681 Transcript_10587/m.14681 type:complete len:277 (+) Transcript_10587:168-998(+)